MKQFKEKKMQYYEYDNFVVVAKRGDRKNIDVIYFYNHEKKQWYINKPGSEFWGCYYGSIRSIENELTKEKLEKAKIPLITEETVFLDRG